MKMAEYSNGGDSQRPIMTKTSLEQLESRTPSSSVRLFLQIGLQGVTTFSGTELMELALQRLSFGWNL